MSSDALRAAVGVSEDDQRAGTDAFDVLDLIVDRRLARRLLTVVDTLGLDPGPAGRVPRPGPPPPVPRHAVVFDTPADVCRARNRSGPGRCRPRSWPPSWRPGTRPPPTLTGEGFDGVHPPEPVEVVPPEMLAAGPQPRGRPRCASACSCRRSPGGPDGGPLADRLAEVAAIAEAVGFTSLWVMDHMVQIPQVGRRWEDMPESWTTLAWLAARTRTIRLGTLVTGVTLRNPAHLAKIVATLDVLSGGRAICGLGLAWWEWEHRLYGWPLPGHGRALRPARGHPAAAAGDVGTGFAAVRGPGRSRSPRPSATPARCRSTSRSSSGAPGKRGRSGWLPGTPTPATCSATPRRWPASGPYWTATAPTPAGTRPRCGSPTCPRRSWPARRGGHRHRRPAAAGRRLPPEQAADAAGRRHRRRPHRALPPAWPKPAWRRPSWPCPTCSPPGRSKRSAR